MVPFHGPISPKINWSLLTVPALRPPSPSHLAALRGHPCRRRNNPQCSKNACAVASSPRSPTHFRFKLNIFAPQSDGQTDPLEAPPWTPGVLAHLVPSRGTHPAQKLESYCCNMARTAKRTDVVTPPRVPAAAPSGRPRLHGPPPASVIVPTPMPTAHGVDPTVYIASWSLVDGTPD